MKTTKEYIELLRTYYQNNADKYGIARMGIFGSVARGEQNSDSDIDIVYEGEANILIRSRIKQELEALFDCKVDVIRLRKALHDSLFGDTISKDIIYV